MKPSIYLHDFTDKETICNDFGIASDTLDNYHVYLAYYHVGDYGCDSSAYVLFEDESGNLFEVHGSHCSCHGLGEESYSGGETQWQPEEVTKEYLAKMMKDSGNDAILYFCGGYDDEVEKSKQACKEVIEFINGKQ